MTLLPCPVLENITIGDTLCDPNAVEPLPFVKISEPTVEMTFSVNNSPFAGREGKFVTSRHLRERVCSGNCSRTYPCVYPTARAARASW